MTNTAWLSKITPELYDALSLDEKGTIPPFPLEKVTKLLKQALQIDDISINIQKMDQIDGDQFFNGLGTKNIVIPLSLLPLNGPFYFVMALDDIKTLISSMTKEESAESSIAIEDESLVKGLYTYFVTETIDAIMQTKVYGDLSLKMTEGSINDLSAYAIDVMLHVKGTNLPSRVLLPGTFLKSIHAYYSFQTPTLENLENIPDINIPLTIRTGTATLKTNQIESLNTGDFIILHNSFYKPSEKKGSFQMLVGGKPIFQVKMQKEGMKVLDYLYFYEEEETMEDDDELLSPLGENNEEDSFDEEFDEELEDDFSDEFEEDDYDDIAEEPLDEPLEEAIKEDPAEEVTPMPDPKKTSLADVPLTISMEVAKLSLSLEELKKLSPGAKLPIHINPTLVNLMISGRMIGKGEVVEIGDTIGVKVLELYK